MTPDSSRDLKLESSTNLTLWEDFRSHGTQDVRRSHPLAVNGALTYRWGNDYWKRKRPVTQALTPLASHTTVAILLALRCAGPVRTL